MGTERKGSLGDFSDEELCDLVGRSDVVGVSIGGLRAEIETRLAPYRKENIAAFRDGITLPQDDTFLDLLIANSRLPIESDI